MHGDVEQVVRPDPDSPQLKTGHDSQLGRRPKDITHPRFKDVRRMLDAPGHPLQYVQFVTANSGRHGGEVENHGNEPASTAYRPGDMRNADLFPRSPSDCPCKSGRTSEKAAPSGRRSEVTPRDLSVRTHRPLRGRPAGKRTDTARNRLSSPPGPQTPGSVPQAEWP